MSDIEAIKHGLEIGVFAGVCTTLGISDAQEVLNVLTCQAAEIEKLRGFLASLTWFEEDDDGKPTGVYFCYTRTPPEISKKGGPISALKGGE